MLGDIYHARLVWHRNGNWRRKGEPPSPDYDPSRWGYPTFEHLMNWRLYWKYSQGPLRGARQPPGEHRELVLRRQPEAVSASGGVFRFKDGREVYDHVYATFDYPDGRTAIFSSIESNAFDHYYEMYMGTKGTLILRREVEAMLFEEGAREQATTLEVTARAAGAPVIDASESRRATAPAPCRRRGRPAARSWSGRNRRAVRSGASARRSAWARRCLGPTRRTSPRVRASVRTRPSTRKRG